MIKKNKKKFLFIAFFLLLTSKYSIAIECDHSIAPHTHLIDGNNVDIAPGDTICIQSGERSGLRIRNIQGLKNIPIIITNQNALVTFTPFEYSIALENSRHVRITSRNQSTENPYMMRMGGTLSIGELSHDIEVDNIEIYRARFAGMMIKTDPDCRPQTWADNFTMYGIHIHHTYIHNTETGEGMYIGYTGEKRTLECHGDVVTVYPHKMQGTHIHHNLIENTGADGIQLNSVQGDAHITHNKIYNTGVSPFARVWQNTGIQIGGDDVSIRNNTIIRSGGNAMMLDGDGLSICDNVIINAGENGIFARNPAQQNWQISGGLPHTYANNLIINSDNYGLKLYATETITPHVIKDNIIETDASIDTASRPKTFSYLNNLVYRLEKNNRHYIFEY